MYLELFFLHRLRVVSNFGDYYYYYYYYYYYLLIFFFWVVVVLFFSFVFLQTVLRSIDKWIPDPKLYWIPDSISMWILDSSPPIPTRCLDTRMKHEARVVDMTSQSRIINNR